MNTEQLFFNGIDGATGEYLFPPLTPEQVSKMAQEEKFDAEHLQELKKKATQVKGRAAIQVGRGAIEGVDPKNLAQTGWGVIFAPNIEQTVKDQLKDLLDYRKQQATQKHEHYYQEYSYSEGDSKRTFLKRHDVGTGPADPDKMPYYLLIVGDPETIPYSFQYQLDVQYAVGRIYFDTPEEYAQYARSVVEAETGKLSLSRQASFFGVCHSGDHVTEASADHLIKPLADWMEKYKPKWAVRTVLKDEATKAQLGRLLGGDETPRLLFTASHGISFPNGDPRQLRHQGALLCQDWPGLGQKTEDFYFSADDVDKDARLRGLIAFHFACYSAGTPQFDYFSKQYLGKREEKAPHAFVAALPKRLLQGGALAVIGHVDPVHVNSFLLDGKHFLASSSDRQLGEFKSTLKRLLEGHPVGSAIEYFNERYAELSSDFSEKLSSSNFRPVADDRELASLWLDKNDARSYVIIGDPAARLVVDEEGGKQTERENRVNLQLPKTAEEKTVSSPSKLQQAQTHLSQAIQDFIDTVEQAPLESAEQLKLAVLAAKTLREALDLLQK